MTAYGNGRMWAVTWEGDTADEARQRLLKLPAGASVICGGARACWMVMGWQELSGGRLGATLAPLNPPSVNPASRLVELPMPDGAE